MPRPRRREQAFDDALNILSALADIVGVAADAASVPALKPVVATLSIVIRRVKDVRTNSETELTFYKKTKTLGEVITGMVNEANTSSGSGSVVLQERLDRLWRVLNEIEDTAGALKDGRGFRGQFKRFISTESNKDILAKMNEQLTNAVTMFSVGTQGATENAVRRVEHRVISEAKRRAIEDIPHVDAGYLSVKEIKSGFMQGTRNDTIGTIKTWTTPEESAKISEPIFLLTAGAGLGKSAVAHQLCLRLTGEWGLNLGASFFFSRGGVDSAYALFSTIARQLALTQPRIRPLIFDAARTFLDGAREQPVRRTFEQLLLKPLAKQPGGAVFNETTFVVIDGLDECRDTSLVPELLRCLLELVRSVPWIRVFLATRPEPYILPVVTSQSAADIIYHRRLDDPQIINESKESVGLYLRETIPKIHPYRDFVRTHPDQLDRLVHRADGLFIYARVAVSYLEMYDTHPEERLTLLLQSGGTRLSPLDQLYLQVLQSAFPPEDLSDWPAMHDRLHNFLTFIALPGFMPLRPSAIALLLTLTDDDVLWMAGRLRAVLLVNGDGDLVPLHATFDEFLVDSTRCIDPLYHVDPQKGHALLARKCFASFSVDAATLYLRSQSERHMDSQASVDREAMSSWRMYVTNWDQHLTSLKPDDELQQDLHNIQQAQPIMARLHDQIDIDVEVITHYLQGSKAAAAICSEYVNFRLYCELWWRKMHGDYTARQAASVTIAELEDKWESFVNSRRLKDTGYSKFCIQTEDIDRYTTVLQGLVNEIRESGAGTLWYNLGIGYRDWDPL